MMGDTDKPVSRSRFFEVRRALEQEDHVKVAVSTTGTHPVPPSTPAERRSRSDTASAPARSRRLGTPPKSSTTKRVLSGGQTELSSVNGPPCSKNRPEEGREQNDALGAGECDQPEVRANHVHAGEHRTRGRRRRTSLPNIISIAGEM